MAASAAADYRWGSLPKFVGKGRPTWLEPATVLMESGALPDDRSGWLRYTRYLEFLATDDLARKELVAEKMSRGWCVGGAGFRREVREEARRKGAELEQARYEGLETSEIQQEREAAWEEQLARLARAGRIDLARLGTKKSDPDKVLLAAAMKQSSSVSNGWLAARLGMGEPASVSQFARRLMFTEDGRADVAAIVSKVRA